MALKFGDFGKKVQQPGHIIQPSESENLIGDGNGFGVGIAFPDAFGHFAPFQAGIVSRKPAEPGTIGCCGRNDVRG